MPPIASRRKFSKFAYENGNAWADLDDSRTLTMRRLYLGGLDSLFARIDAQGDVTTGPASTTRTPAAGSARTRWAQKGIIN